MKNKMYRLGLLAGLFSVALPAFANTDGCPPTGKCIVHFVAPYVDFRDVACEGAARNITYTLHNKESNTISLYGVQVTNLPGEVPDTSGVTFAIQPSGCINNVSNSIGSGTIAGGSTCTLTLQVTPPTTCPFVPGSTTVKQPLQTPIHRQLFIGVMEDQAYLSADLLGKVSVIGAGEDFAIIGNAVSNVATSGASHVNGDLGYGSITGNIIVNEGTARTGTDTYLTAASSDFASAYRVLTGLLGNASPVQCLPRNSIDAGAVLQPGIYCLQPPASVTSSYVTIGSQVDAPGEPIKLIGDGTGLANFYFFVDSSPASAACKAGTAAKRCDLQILSGAHFAYENGASPANVFWIMGNSTMPVGMPNTFNNAGTVYLNNNAALDGAVLQGALTRLPNPAIVSSSGGTSPTLVTGNLWTVSTLGNITLNNNTVSTPTQAKVLAEVK